MRQKPISELRRRMLEDMAARKMSETTCHNYIRHIAEFAKFLGRPPDMATADDVRRFQVPCPRVASGFRRSTLRPRRSVSSLAQRSIDLSWPGISPACITHGHHRAWFHRRR